MSYRKKKLLLIQSFLLLIALIIIYSFYYRSNNDNQITQNTTGSDTSKIDKDQGSNFFEDVLNDIDAVEDEAQSLMDRTKSDARQMIEDASNRFNDKVSGMEGYVKRELGSLEEDLDRKLQKSLDNPLANR